MDWRLRTRRAYSAVRGKVESGYLRSTIGVFCERSKAKEVLKNMRLVT